MRATVYNRWSDKHQSRGSSLARQKAGNTAFAIEMGWQVDPTPLIDDGFSAYSGANIERGSLGAFEREILKNGGEGRVLVVEKMDRLSRRDGFDVLVWITRMIDAGLSIAIVNLRMVVNAVSIREQKDQLRTIIEEAEQANAYARTLSTRVGEAWSIMRSGKLVFAASDGVLSSIERVRGHDRVYRLEVSEAKRREPRVYHVNKRSRRFAVGDAITDGDLLGKIVKKVHTSQTCPAWLELVEDRTTFVVRPEIASLIERIYRLYLASFGARSIAKIFNQEDIETLRFGSAWRGSTIKTLLDDKSVIGEYRYRIRGEETGEVVPNYFPAIIDLELWQEVHDRRHAKIMSSHSRTSKLRHLFADVGRCQSCGGKLTFVTKRVTPDNRFDAYAVCAGAYLAKSDCPRQSMRMINVEDTFLDHMLALIMDDQHFETDADVTPLRRQIAGLQKAFEDANERVETLSYRMEQKAFRDDAILMNRYIEARDDAKKHETALEGARKKLAEAMGAVSPAEHIKRVGEIRADLWSSDEVVGMEARRRVKMAINDIVHSFTVDATTQQAVILLKDSVRHFLLDWNGALIMTGSIWRDEAVKADSPEVKDYFRRLKAA